MFRFISKKSDGSLISFVFGNMHEAYKHCVPEEKATWHIMMYYAVKECFDKGEALVLVSYDDYEMDVAGSIYTANYIQHLTDGYKTTFPELPIPPVKLAPA